LTWIGYTLVIIVSGWLFLYQHGKHQEFYMILVVGSILVVVNVQSLLARIHGQSVEKRAIRDLEKIDKTKVTKNQILPGRGDIDVVFKARNETFNIEIKSIEDANKVSRKHIAQVLAASDYLKTSPIIWLPKAKKKRVVRRGGVMVFCGTARQLYSHLN